MYEIISTSSLLVTYKTQVLITRLALDKIFVSEVVTAHTRTSTETYPKLKFQENLDATKWLKFKNKIVARETKLEVTFDTFPSKLLRR